MNILTYNIALKKTAKIDWSSSTTSLMEFQITTDHESPSWSQYISHFVNNRLINSVNINEKTNTGDLRTVYTWMVKYFPCLNYNITSQQPIYDTISTPCNAFQFTSWEPVDKVWMITVNKDFMINITIEKAYVPLTKHCPYNDSAVLVFEGHAFDLQYAPLCSRYSGYCGGFIQSFCGHIYMETVYSKHYKATLMFRNSLLFTQFETMLKMIYQVMTQGLAHRKRMPYFYTKYANIVKSLRPSYFQFEDQVLSHIWYLSNAISGRANGMSDSAEEISPKTAFGKETSMKASVVCNRIIVSDFTCRNSTLASVQVFPGLLSTFMRKWKIPPKIKLHCNINKHAVINTTFHMYATVELTYSVLLEHVNILIFFTFNEWYISTVDTLSNLDALPNVDNQSTFKLGYLTQPHDSVQVNSFIPNTKDPQNILSADIHLSSAYSPMAYDSSPGQYLLTMKHTFHICPGDYP